jgi:hypothetical protein
MIETSGGGLLEATFALQFLDSHPSKTALRLRSGQSEGGHPQSVLAFRLAASQLLHLRLFRSASVVAGFLRFFRFRLFAGGAFCFFAVFSA